MKEEKQHENYQDEGKKSAINKLILRVKKIVPFFKKMSSDTSKSTRKSEPFEELQHLFNLDLRSFDHEQKETSKKIHDFFLACSF